MLKKREIELIAKYKTTDNQYGYNIANGGNTVGTLSEETKRKISQWHKENSNRYNTDEIKGKISKANKGKTAWNKGLHWSEEYKKQNAMKQKCIPVLCVETNQVYYGIMEAERQTGIDKSSITRACKGKVPRAGGFHWKYIDS